MITPSTIEQIKSRLDIIDVVGEFVKLKKRGSNYLGNCPFHNEKTPSFTVSPAKELYKCFGCGKSGNTITFVMEHEKLSYVEALRWLAARYNIEVEETQVSNEQKQLIQVADSLYIINSFAAKFFDNQLFNTEDGQAIAMSYLKQRGFREEILKKFQIGYNPAQRDTLAKELIGNQFNRELLPRTGLVAVRNETELVDNYRGRIIFPIHSNSGKIIGFGARVIGKAEKAPKYINTPENELYSKSKILYGSYFARQAIDKQDECLLVEGYTDVVSLHQAGIENVVASGGTSLTIDQLRLVKKYTSNLTIIYDGDSAGIKAALRGLDMALEEGLNVKLVLIPDNEDPDSYVNKVGTAAFQQFIANNKKDFILFQLEVMLKDAGTDLTKKNTLVNQIAETISKINKAEDFTKQQEYIKQCAALLKIDEAGLITLVNKIKRDKVAKEDKKLSLDELNNQLTTDQQETSTLDDTSFLISADEKQEQNIIRVLLDFGLNQFTETETVAEYIFAGLQDFPFENPQLEQLLERYKTEYRQGLEPSTKTFLYSEDKETRELVIAITLFPYELSSNWDKLYVGKTITNQDNSHQDVLTSMNYYKLCKLKKMFKQNQIDLEKATKEEATLLIKIHFDLQKMVKEITKEGGTVILK
ncbi:DNA primase [Parasediminibacterium sp. JCM 36343]|uniref:DNA primase n=1 Tax=Parasediminibacterium sp. JCM 36343 TaxID=3374279 RepID=UPI0039785BC1